MKALIVGGGIAGPVTAMALRRAGIDAVVFEAHAPAAQDIGSYLTVASNGIDALRAIDADRAVVDAGFPTRETVLYSGSGRRLGAAPIGSARPDRPVSRTIKRARLQRALHDEAVRRGVRFEFGRRLIDADAGAAGVCARFDDGSTAAGDVLVGCDGVHSVTRRLIDPGAPAPRYVGLLNFGGYTPGIAAGEPGAWRMIFGRRAFFGCTVDPHGGTVWFANVPRAAVSAEERRRTSLDEWKRQLLGLVADDRGPARDLIAAGRLELAADNTHDLPHVPRWHRAPLVAIGDAAHAPSPTSGQGASLAIEDGVLLAKCLRDRPAISDAFAAFDQLRRRRVERIVAQGARTSSNKTAGPAGRLLRDLLLPFVLRYVVTSESQAWIYDHRVDWDERVAVAA
jgi:2-polyprenyl-6-methoxyphenol hydroxylase-like FAD-dependent oxidoreductase